MGCPPPAPHAIPPQQAGTRLRAGKPPAGCPHLPPYCPQDQLCPLAAPPGPGTPAHRCWLFWDGDSWDPLGEGQPQAGPAPGHPRSSSSWARPGHGESGTGMGTPSPGRAGIWQVFPRAGPLLTKPAVRLPPTGALQTDPLTRPRTTGSRQGPGQLAPALRAASRDSGKPAPCSRWTGLAEATPGRGRGDGGTGGEAAWST